MQYFTGKRISASVLFKSKIIQRITWVLYGSFCIPMKIHTCQNLNIFHFSGETLDYFRINTKHLHGDVDVEILA